ncbi:Type 1 glutamine amidotransferase-like domain-containing protein [Bifidobacterium sp. 64T4]|uniref:Type 1 glutamine amidotransferase-like domain-containing protein n=1 Tax=Bifidobacterium pongonis TaxID=2834432 RepID=UPI001C578E6F|nr:Type 1 glutamine amidotransferase-like domain-containing protein [Bifidobacterium pongonis]MBW3094751.1 Type 1 glutamine amidotransferase-like domain-containing protein [Bifidobacterium pongonis]
MGKLMLASTFAPVSHMLGRLEPDLKGRTVAFIPTASMKDSTGFFNRMAKWKLRALGLNVQEIDVAVASYHDIKTTIASSSMIYVTGGNTFYLLQSLRYSSADELIAQAVQEGKTYIGESAGAVVAGPNIEYIKRMDSEDPAPYLDSNYAGLGLVDFSIVPHIGGPTLGESAADIMRHDDGTRTLVPIRDDQAVLVNGPRVEIVDR